MLLYNLTNESTYGKSVRIILAAIYDAYFEKKVFAIGYKNV